MRTVPEGRGISMRSPLFGTYVLLLAAILNPISSKSAWAEAAGPAKVDGAKCNRAGFRVVLDVGHTQEVPGAKSARGVPEYEFNLRLAKLIEQKLIEAGFGRTVLMITGEPPHTGLYKRAARANGLNADLFLSIHHDAVPDRLIETWQYEGQEHQFSDRFHGHSIFISEDNPNVRGSLLFGKLLGEQMEARGLHYTPHYTQRIMGSRQRELLDAKAGVYRYDQLIVLRDTRMPAVLFEAGSIVNRDEELLLATPEHQSLIAAAATDAVTAFCAARSPFAPIRQANPVKPQPVRAP
jgi:N-acetylmuramoyl-L-alanine amidase